MKKEKIVLEPWNQRTYEEVKEFLEKDKRCAIVNTMGTGKSSILNRLMQDYPDEDILLIAPEWNILNSFEERETYPDNVTTITYAGLHAAKKKKQIKNMRYGLILADEMDYTGADEWGEAFYSLLKNNPDSLVVGATGTPTREDGQNMVEIYFKGNYAGKIGMVEAIEMGIMIKPQYVGTVYSIQKDLDDQNKKIANPKLTEDQRDTLLGLQRGMIVIWESMPGLEKVFQDFLVPKYENKEGLKLLVFCNDIKSIEEIKDSVLKYLKKIFQDARILPFEYHVRSKNQTIKDKVNRFRHNRFPKTIQVMFCVNMLNSGMHVDDLDAVIMFNATESNRKFSQLVGRAMSINRKDECLIIDAANNYKNKRVFRDYNELLGEKKRSGDQKPKEWAPRDKEEKSVDIENYYGVKDLGAFAESFDDRYENFTKTEYKGKMYTTTELSRLFRFPHYKVSEYLDAGMTAYEMEELSELINKKETVDGKKMDRKEMMEEFDIPERYICAYMSDGLSFQEIKDVWMRDKEKPEDDQDDEDYEEE